MDTKEKEITRVDSAGTKFWYNKEGKLHRDGDLPAVVYPDGGREYYRNGVTHRDRGPAVVMPSFNDSYKVKYYRNGKIHRVGGPAVYRSGHKEYWFRDKLLYSTLDVENECVSEARK